MWIAWLAFVVSFCVSKKYKRDTQQTMQLEWAKYFTYNFRHFLNISQIVSIFGWMCCDWPMFCDKHTQKFSDLRFQHAHKRNLLTDNCPRTSAIYIYKIVNSSACITRSLFFRKVSVTCSHSKTVFILTDCLPIFSAFFLNSAALHEVDYARESVSCLKMISTLGKKLSLRYHGKLFPLARAPRKLTFLVS